MPWTAWRRTSSAIMKAFCIEVSRATVASSFSLGIAITVSTDFFSSSRPSSAWSRRRRPSKPNGFVTTATTSAPSSAARPAMIGEAPVPVPPPRPAVTNTMSAPTSASSSRSVSSSAASRPISGLAPAPRPRVSWPPIWIFRAARDSSSACRSVFTLMNSTPATPAPIIRLIALFPPPPTPTTLITAPSGVVRPSCPGKGSRPASSRSSSVNRGPDPVLSFLVSISLASRRSIGLRTSARTTAKPAPRSPGSG